MHCSYGFNMAAMTSHENALYPLLRMLPQFLVIFGARTYFLKPLFNLSILDYQSTDITPYNSSLEAHECRTLK